jgi:hypothetical protein
MDDQERQRLARWLSEKWKHGPCPVCQSNSWATAQRLGEIYVLGDAGSRREAASFSSERFVDARSRSRRKSPSVCFCWSLRTSCSGRVGAVLTGRFRTGMVPVYEPRGADSIRSQPPWSAPWCLKPGRRLGGSPSVRWSGPPPTLLQRAGVGVSHLPPRDILARTGF